MRRLFVLLMVVLLPLRGWAGDLMGVHMALSSPAVQMATLPSDCPMHTQVDAAPHTLASDADGVQAMGGMGGMGNCSSCELCIPIAQAPSAQPELVSFAAHAKPQMGGAEFMSAAPVPVVKPPIC